MSEEILRWIKDEYSGQTADGRVFFNLSDYAMTAYSDDSGIKISVELPSAADNAGLLADIASSVNADCEYVYPALVLTFDAESSAYSSIAEVLGSLTALLSREGIQPNICVYCKSQTDQRYNLNGFNCPLHRDCANTLLGTNSSFTASTKAQRIKGLLVGAAFSFFGAAFYILFAHLGIMPALGGIPMGLLAALGFRMFNKGMKKSDKAIFAAIFLLWAAAANFAADYVYAAVRGLQLDFIATYTDELNLFNTVFDVAAGVIIAVSSLSVVLDFNRSVGGFQIKKLPGDKSSGKH
ncbi:MAG: hypothetical protein PUC05_07480 [Firmicutes bacterium]|nr:hypothetical protein [Bacillota bacterium]